MSAEGVVGHQLGCHFPGKVGLKPAGTVNICKFDEFTLGILSKLVALTVEVCRLGVGLGDS